MEYSKGIELPQGVVVEAHEYLNQQLDSVDKANKRIHKAVETAKMIMAVEAEELQQFDFSQNKYFFSQAVSVSNNLISSLQNNVLLLNKVASNVPSFLTQPNIYLIDSDEQKDGFQSASPIQLYLEDEAIWIQMPMLWSKANRRIRGSNNRNIGPSRLTIYDQELFNAFINAKNFNDYDFGKFNYKLIHFCYVYRDLSTNMKFVIDNDNHETKYVQDVICSFLKAGDEPFSTCTFSSAFKSNKIPEGTYVTVRERQKGIFSDKDITDFWVDKPNKILMSMS